MTTRVPTGETPFRLTFGIEAVIPVEVGLKSLMKVRRTNRSLAAT